MARGHTPIEQETSRLSPVFKLKPILFIGTLAGIKWKLGLLALICCGCRLSEIRLSVWKSSLTGSEKKIPTWQRRLCCERGTENRGQTNVTRESAAILGTLQFVRKRPVCPRIKEPYVAICGVYPTHDIDLIRKNYAVTLEFGRITSLVEKPEIASAPFVGCGTYLLDPEIFRDSRQTRRSSRSGRLELVDILNHAAQRGAAVLPFVLCGQYINVNTIRDLNVANKLCASFEIPVFNRGVIT